MALKPQRQVFIETMDYTCVAVIEPGAIAVLQAPTGTQGVNPNQNEFAPVAVQLPGAAPSGTKVCGVNLSNIVATDTTRFFRNPYNAEQFPGEPIQLMKDGVVSTNWVTGTTPTVLAPAYVGANSKFTTTPTPGGVTPSVGVFLSTADSDGYYKIAVKIA